MKSWGKSSGQKEFMKKEPSRLWKEGIALQVHPALHGKVSADWISTSVEPTLDGWQPRAALIASACDGAGISGSCHLPQAVEPQHCQPENLKDCGPNLSSAIIPSWWQLNRCWLRSVTASPQWLFLPPILDTLVSADCVFSRLLAPSSIGDSVTG